MQELPERTIIAEICAGDHDQYRHLVVRYHRGLIQHLFNIVHDQGSAEDLAQEAFIKAFEKIQQYNPDYAFSTWLYKIADNQAYRFLKQQKQSINIDNLEQLLPDTGASPSTLTEQLLRRSAIQRAVEALPRNYQRVIKMYYWDNLDYAAISDIMDRPIGTVRTWLRRAKKQLGEELYGRI